MRGFMKWSDPVVIKARIRTLMFFWHVLINNVNKNATEHMVGGVFKGIALVTHSPHMQRGSNSLTRLVLPPRLCGFPDLLAGASSLSLSTIP